MWSELLLNVSVEAAMKILVISPFFHPHIGGSERYIEELYAALLKIDQTIQVDILTYNTNNSSEVENYKGMTIYRVGCVELLKDQFALPNYIELLILLIRLKKNGYTIVNPHTRFFDVSWWGWIAARYLGARAVLTDHCASHPQHENRFIGSVAWAVDRLMMPMLSKFYDEITVVSWATKNFWTHSIKGIEEKITVIPNGIRLDLFTGGTSHKVKAVRFVGREIRNKGGKIFDDMVKGLKKSYPDVIFERVNGVTHEEVIKRLNHTSIFVHPSTHHEGLPTVILEAGLAGCAVIATDMGGTNELIIDGKTGLIAKPSVGDISAKVEELLNDPFKQLMLGQALRRKVLNEYGWQRIAQQYLGTLNN